MLKNKKRKKKEMRVVQKTLMPIGGAPNGQN
jgi:hypothetical protein